MIKPTPTTCMAISLLIPNRLQAKGISKSEPPATPDAPQAPTAEMTQRRNAVAKSTGMSSVCTAESVSTAIVIAAPDMLMVAPSGMDTEYVSSSKPSFWQRFILTGIFAAELRVKKAYKPLSRRVVRTSGYGLIRILTKAIKGFITNAMKKKQPSNTASNFT